MNNNIRKTKKNQVRKKKRSILGGSLLNNNAATIQDKLRQVLMEDKKIRTSDTWEKDIDNIENEQKYDNNLKYKIQGKEHLYRVRRFKNVPEISNENIINFRNKNYIIFEDNTPINIKIGIENSINNDTNKTNNTTVEDYLK